MNLDSFEKEQIILISQFFPFPYFDIKKIFVESGKSFDGTVRVLNMKCKSLMRDKTATFSRRERRIKWK